MLLVARHETQQIRDDSRGSTLDVAEGRDSSIRGTETKMSHCKGFAN